jgi:dTDP-4-dehydrorhamnose reductase
MHKVLITGGSGALGTQLLQQIPSSWEVYAPTRTVCDITDYKAVCNTIEEFKPNTIIHAAGYVDTFGCENDIKQALEINVIGTINLVKASLSLDCKFVYISSEYVFGGDNGMYSVKDRLDPKNAYGKTKAAAEYIVTTLPTYQIIRAPFVRKIYDKAFTDQYSSKNFLKEAAAKIITNIQHNKEPIVHIAADRLSLYELYTQYGYSVIPTTMSVDLTKILPKDTSLISNEYE